MRAALTLRNVNKPTLGDLATNDLVDELAAQTAAARSGDLSRLEDMLTTQAATLDALFHDLTRRALLNAGEYLGAAETYMRLALKAQSQCRMTIEALSEVKNPRPVAFVNQANIAHGPQQVNNGGRVTAATPALGKKGAGEKIGLLEQACYAERVDPTATRAAGRADSALEALEPIDRSPNS